VLEKVRHWMCDGKVDVHLHHVADMADDRQPLCLCEVRHP
jgi:hypothetical protein